MNARGSPDLSSVVFTAHDDDDDGVRGKRTCPQQVSPYGWFEVPNSHSRTDHTVRHLPVVDCRSPHHAQGKVGELVHVNAKVVPGKTVQGWVRLARQRHA